MSSCKIAQVKTVRFSQVVQKSGKPEVYLLWAAPEQDSQFAKALKAGRIMTVHQGHGHTDFGVVGYEKGANEQLLIFPKSLKSFEDKRVVGVKYDLVAEHEVPQSQRAKLDTPAKKKKSGAYSLSPGVTLMDDEEEEKKEEAPPKEKPTPKPTSPAPKVSAPSSTISPKLKKELKKILRLLKNGKQVQAYEVLQALLDDA